MAPTNYGTVTKYKGRKRQKVAHWYPTPSTVRTTLRKLSDAGSTISRISSLIDAMSSGSGMSGISYTNPFVWSTPAVQPNMNQGVSRTQTQTKREGSKTMTRTSGPHTYAGRFKKPKKPKKDFFGTCKVRGYVVRQEVFGRWGTEPHGVYFYVSTFAKDLIAKALYGAFVRRVLAKAGISLGATRQEIPGIDYNNSDGLQFEYRVLNQITGAITLVGTQSTLGDDSIVDVVDDAPAAIMNSIRAWLAGDRGNMPHSLVFFRQEVSGLGDPHMHATLELQDASFYVAVKAVCTVQNRTKGEITDGNNSDVVDNQPVKGYVYQFKHGDPRLKQTGVSPNMNFVERVPDNGTALVGASSLGSDFDEPPKANWWQNCNKIAAVRLQAGQSKTFGITHVYKGTFKNHRQFASQTSVNHNVGCSGRSVMLGLTEVLRTSNAELLSFKYEHEHVVGAYVKERHPRKSFHPKLSRAEINIDPPP